MTQLIEFKNHRGKILRSLLNKANSNIGVVFIHGFERTSVERKFKNIVDALIGRVNLLRFDFSGCGFSDGNFDDTTCRKLTKELGLAISILGKRRKINKMVLVAHSFGCCAALQYASIYDNIHKLILLAPALNQKELQLYWYVVLYNKKKRITWKNYRHYFSKQAFLKEMNKPKRLSKEHYISKQYFLENKDMDYQCLLKEINPKITLIVHGDADNIVPIESNDQIPEEIKFIRVVEGDHDLQRIDMVKQYLPVIIKAIKE